MTDFTITKNWLNEHQTNGGGYTRGQLEALSLPWPPPAKWKREVTGRRITATSKVVFEEAKRIVAGPDTIKVKCLMRHFTKAQLMEIDRYIKRLLGTHPGDL